LSENLLEKSILAQLIDNFSAFYIEPKGLLLCSEEHTTGHFPEPIIPVHNVIPYILTPILIVYFHLCLLLLSGSFHSDFPIKLTYRFSHFSYKCNIPCTSQAPSFVHHYNIWENYKYEFSCYAVFL